MNPYTSENENEIKSAADLFGRYQVIPKKKQSERGALLEYFAHEVDRPIKFVAIRMAHYSVDELYAIQSGFTDRKRRDSIFSARKWWWWMTKTKKVAE